jgi:site-specific DNA-methyltransferase (adenine-specific)
MIYVKDSCPFPQEGQYNQIFEYMFVLSKGKLKTFNPIRRQNNWGGLMKPMTHRQADGSLKASTLRYNKESNYGNVWLYGTGYGKSATEKQVFEHPAIYPEALAEDHVKSWSNEGDTVLDCFSGSGTTMKAAKLLKRNSIGIEIAKEYCELTVRRVNKPIPLFEAAS